METVAKSVGRTLRARRRELGLSQALVGQMNGKAQPQIAALEAGKGDPRLSGVVQTARTLGLELMLIPVQKLPAVRHVLGLVPVEDRDRLVGVSMDEDQDDEEDHG